MATPSPGKISLLVHGAAVVGRTMGQLRRRWLEAAQDAYVEAWQAAWMEGCSAGWGGQPVTSVPYNRNPPRDAWTAGWNWAHTQPDRRNPARTDTNGPVARRRSTERRRHLVSAAKYGGLSLTVLATARWLARLRARPKASVSAPPPNEP